MNITSGLKIFFLFLWCIMSCLPPASQAADKVVVIPLFGHGKPLKNIVTVAKANGMFTDPVAAVNSITDASADNPYLVVIGPGVYTLTHTLVMKPWVDITGSGENVTRLVGAISGGSADVNSAIVSGVTDAVMTELTVENNGGGNYSIAIFNYGAFSGNVRLRQITAISSGGLSNYAVFNENSSPTLEQVTIRASGGSISCGIYNDSSYPILIRVNTIASGGTFNYGIHNKHSVPSMIQVITKAYNGEQNFGIYNNSSGLAKVLLVTSEGSGGSKSYGMYNVNSSMMIGESIKQSIFFGATYALVTDRELNISQSTIRGGVSGAGVKRCVACDDGNGNTLNNSCQ